MRFILFITLILLLLIPVLAKTIHVPADKATIQEGIDDALEGDTVLVAPGEYFENILFKGKNIKVVSEFIIDNNHDTIEKTIINGSKPADVQKGSCVRIISGEDSTTVLEGFTLTGGTGTKWKDEHGAGNFYEGGGILIALSSPTIRNNIIYNNVAINKSAVGAGGGGIRIGDSSPIVYNNIITSNKGMYGGGIVLNYASAKIKNNIISNNKVYQAASGVATYGGGGIWVNSKGSGQNIIENNTITGNSSSGSGSKVAGYGGGILLWLTSAAVNNNIIWGNSQSHGKQLHNAGSTISVTYNDIEGGFSGEGNINSDPLFVDGGSVLGEESPCIDAGHMETSYNDPEDPSNTGQAKYPSKGTVRNDMGAYGGPLRAVYELTLTGIKDQKLNYIPSKIELYQNYPNPFNPSTIIKYRLKNQSYVHLYVYDVSGRAIDTIVNKNQNAGEHLVSFNASNLASGIYIYTLKTDDFEQSRKMVLLH